MRFQLLEIVLWSRNPFRPPRRLKFEPGMTNVITGGSKTGKSAVIPIVDYCLGSDRCAVPVATIRDACSWFGVLIATDEGEKLLARREPGRQLSTGDMLLVEGRSVEVPESAPEKNTTVDAVKRVLDRLAGLSNLGFDPTGLAGGFKGRPSFRDMAAFVFQPQNIVANPDVLFYKADTTEHREKLRTIFPYVLGAMTPELLAKRWEMDQVQRDLRRLERELSARSQATERWKSELRAWISEARQLGLVAQDDVLDGREDSEMLDILRDVVEKSSREASVTAAAVETSSREASELDHEEAAVALRLSEVRSRMEKMIRLRETVDEYTGSLQKQRDRLGLSRWLRELQHNATCPLCGGDFKSAQHELDLLCDALAEVEASARQMSPVPAAFDRELVQVREEVRRYTDQLQAVRLRRRRLEERSQREGEDAWQRSAVDRFLGRVEQALSMLASPTVDDEVRANLENLRVRLEELRNELSEAGIRSRIRSSLSRISGFMSRVLPSLDAERPHDPVELDIDELTIRVTGESGRADYLWEVGSGANWLSYHVAATLALHELFLGQAASPVPGMLVYDQPSQVYFPQTLARKSASEDDRQLRDEDVAAVRKVFEAFGRSVTSANGRLQVIVLDHAGPEVWGEVPGVHLVQEWREGRALVPPSWVE
jgi:energy-coupling factor transporter ATP-binding protein EcfA2